MRWKGVINKYKEYLPVSEKTPVITLNEGNTPLIKAENLQKALNIGFKIYLKYEGLNPTCSFKDRGMTLAVSKAVEEKSKAVICASTGNTSASAAAYAARAGIKAFVLIPEGKIALGKLSQAMMHGAQVIQVRGNFDEALNIVRQISDNYPITLVNSLNPYRIEGQKTAAFEVCDQLNQVPTYHILPVGNAGNITAYWKGYREYKQKRITESLPQMIGFQAEGAAPIVHGHIIEKPETVATAIRIGNPASWKTAEAAAKESGGLIDLVSDEEIIKAYKILAALEGVFCEPASAATIAGLIKLNKQEKFKGEGIIVCTLTGHGLKDPDLAIKVSPETTTVSAKIEEVIKILGY